MTIKNTSNMSLRDFLTRVAVDVKRDDKFVETALKLFAQPGELHSMRASAGSWGTSQLGVAGADITEVEHLANVELGKLRFDNAVSGGMMGFLVALNSQRVSPLAYVLWCAGRSFKKSPKERETPVWR